jgi:DNA polymerase III epsilon subunit-like protein
MEQRLVFLDLETGGLNPKKHPILQVAAVATDADLQPVEAFENKIIFAIKSADRHSLRKNHYHAGTWAREAREEPEVARDLADFLRRHASLERLSSAGEAYSVAQLVAHNATFDSAFLDEWFRRVGIFLPAGRQVLCTMQRAMWFFSERPDLRPPKDFKLATLCDFFGVPFHAAKAHEALADVSATVALYAAIRRGYFEKHEDVFAIPLSNGTRKPTREAVLG